MPTSFAPRDLPHLGKKVFPLGIALNYGVDEGAVAAAFDRGVNYVFWPLRGKKMVGLLRDRIQRDREKMIIATGPTIGYFGGSVRRTAEKALRALGTDYLDVFQLMWLGVGSALTDGTMEELVKLRESGKARTIGISIHDRARAGKLATESALDLYMIRYNAAHPGAERDIFPHLHHKKPAVVAYTATAWRKLLKAPSGWTGPVPTAGDCYRFCLSNPNVHVTLTGPASAAQLEENLRALDRGPLDEEEQTWMRSFGQVVHDKSSKIAQSV